MAPSNEIDRMSLDFWQLLTEHQWMRDELVALVGAGRNLVLVSEEAFCGEAHEVDELDRAHARMYAALKPFTKVEV